MKRMKPENKRKVAGIVAVVLVLAMVLSAMAPLFLSRAYAADVNEGFSIETNCGFNGKAKINSMASLKFDITNNSGEDFEGSIVLPMRDASYSNDGSSTNYYNRFEKNVQILNGNTVSVEFDSYIYAVKPISEILLVNKKGKTVYERAFESDELDTSNQAWLGMLSDSPENLKYLSPTYWVDGGEAVELGAEDFESDIEILKSFDVIAINDYNTSQLSQDAVRNIADWVENGGVLLVGLGADGERVSGGLDRLLGTGVGQMGVGNQSSGVINANQNEKTAYNSTNYIQLGKGKIIVHKFDIGLDMNMIATMVYQNEISQVYSSISDSEDMVYENLYGYADRLPDLSDKTIIFVFGIIYIYVLALGPVLYIFLKKRDRRELAVRIIPILGVGITVVIYILSFASPYKKPVASVISIFNMSEGGFVDGDVDTAINVIAPFKNKLNIRLGSGFELKDIASDLNARYSNEGAEKAINLTNGVDISMRGVSKWQNTYIMGSNQLNYEGDFDIQADMTQDAKISITNNTGYYVEDCVATLLGRYYKIGDIEAGQTVEVGIDEEYATEENILTDGQRWNSDLPRERQYELELRQDIVSSALADGYQNGIFKLVAFNGEDIIGDEFSVNSKKITKYSTNVFVKTCRIEPQKIGGVVLTRDNLNFEVQGAAGEVDGEYIMPLYESGTVFVNASGLYGINIDEFDITAVNNGGVAIYNLKTDEWDNVEGYMQASEPDSYVDSSGVIRLQMTITQGETNVELPLFNIKTMTTE